MSGKLVVISGFSGAGKGTVISRLRSGHDGYALSVSMTTRKPREGETDGVEYHFVTNEVFEDLIEHDGLLEHAGFVDHYYGTPRAFVEDNMRAGRDVLLEIEVQGAMQIREKFPEATLIFVSPPDAEELLRRLFGRATEKKETAMKRLRRALEEVKLIPAYPFLVINGEVEACVESLQAVIEGRYDGKMDNAGFFVPGGEVITDPRQKQAFADRFQKDLTAVLARID